MGETIVSFPERQPQVPEHNATQLLEGLYSMVGAITAKTRIRDSEFKQHRPLSLRNKRADLYHKALEYPEERAGIFAEARARDEIAAQYLTQGSVRVNLPGLGEQEAQYTMIEPPVGRRTIENASKPPIFLVPGMSNDIDCVGWLAQEIPYEGRAVIVVGFPESFMGSTTEEFAKAVEQADDYGPHVEFYKNAINTLIGEQGDVELWGFSTGAPIIAQMLNDKDFQQRVTNAAFISPASSVDQSMLQLGSGIVGDTADVVRHFTSSAKYTLTGLNRGLKRLDDPHKKLRDRVLKGTLRKAIKKSKYYETARVRDGGSMVFFSGNKDGITKSHRAIAMFSRNPQARIIESPRGHHSTPLIYPETVVPKILRAESTS